LLHLILFAAGCGEFACDIHIPIHIQPLSLMTPFDIILWSVSYPSCSSIHLSSSASQLPAPPSSLDQLQLGILSREIVCLDLSFADNPSLSLSYASFFSLRFFLVSASFSYPGLNSFRILPPYYIIIISMDSFSSFTTVWSLPASSRPPVVLVLHEPAEG
jgi:hypothetical protein